METGSQAAAFSPGSTKRINSDSQNTVAIAIQTTCLLRVRPGET
jgi:hypothetical protein